jgi:beta-galactosidase GanA
LRTSAEHQLLFVINHTASEKSVDVPKGNREILTDKPTAKLLTLEPFGVAVIELPLNDAKSSHR